MRKPCTEQDYYDIRTACDNEHKVGDPVSLQFLSPEETADLARRRLSSQATVSFILPSHVKKSKSN